MWKLSNDELKGVRTRFMKFLSFLLASFQKMYENIKTKNSKDFGKNKNSEETKAFYNNLLETIKLEENDEKKKKLILLKNSVEAKFGNLLKKE